MRPFGLPMLAFMLAAVPQHATLAGSAGTALPTAPTVIDAPDPLRILFRPNALFLDRTAPLTPLPPLPDATAQTPQACCRYCCTGKPCGDSCINRNLTCHQPPGCACWGC